jgi:hypothetical protein
MPTLSSLGSFAFFPKQRIILQICVIVLFVFAGATNVNGANGASETGGSGGSRGKCGFAQMAQHYHQSQGNTSSASHQSAALSLQKLSGETCQYTDLFDSVYQFTTPHFVIYYTLSGPHRVFDWENGHNSAYLSLLAQELEKAWNRMSDSVAFNTPLPSTTTHLFKKKPPQGKYPVEIANLAHEPVYTCAECYGITIPDDTIGSGRSTLLIENDFLYPTDNSPLVSIPKGTSNCLYRESTMPIYASIVLSNTNGNQDTTINYNTHWQEAVTITAHHELYHSFQLRYEDYRQELLSWHFWYEASAVASEVIGSPTSIDYMQYLRRAHLNTSISLHDLDQDNGYKRSPFYLFLMHKFKSNFDSQIWQARNTDRKNQKHIMETFKTVLQQKYNASLDELFHEYARSLFFSGSSVPNASIFFHPAIPTWPPLRKTTNFPSQSWFTPEELNIDVLGYQYFQLDEPHMLDSYLNWEQLAQQPDYMVSIITLENNSVQFIPVNDYTSLPSLAKSTQAQLLITRGWSDESATPSPNSPDTPFIGAYPNPFTPNKSPGKVCFATSAQAKQPTFVRIFSQDGQMRQLINLSQSNCWNGTFNGQAAPPGLYYYQITGDSKLRKLIILQ